MHMSHDELEALLSTVKGVALEALHGLVNRPPAVEQTIRPAALRPVLPGLGDDGLGPRAALELFRHRFEAGLSGSAGPRYLGFVTGGTTPAALAGDWLVPVYDQNLSHCVDSVAWQVELEVLAMLADLFGLDDGLHGVLVSGATQANLVALATARQWAAERLGIDVAEEGLFAMPQVPILGGAPHASIFKVASILGMGRSSVETLALAPGRRTLDPAALETRLRAAKGPCIVVAGAGEVDSGQFDPLTDVAELCRAHGAWLHVDGAFGLFAACDPDRRARLDGLESADSVVADGHKWLNVPYDCGFVWTRRSDLQEKVFRAAGAYLGDGSGDLLNLTPENSRRFRALPAWMTLQAYGRRGYRELVRRNCEQASRLGEWIAGRPELELLFGVELNIVCFGFKTPEPTLRDRLLSRLRDDGVVYLTATRVDDRPAVRAAFSNWSTTDDDLDRILDSLERALALL